MSDDPRERVRRAADELIAGIRDAALAMTMEVIGLCPDHGHQLRTLGGNAYGCPRAGCKHQRILRN